MDARKRFRTGLRLISLAVLVVGWNHWCRVEDFSFSWGSEWEHFWRGLVARHDLSLFAVTILVVALVEVGVFRCVDALAWGGAGGTQGSDTGTPSADRDGPLGDRTVRSTGGLSAQETRAMILTRLVEWDAPLQELAERLGEFPWDSERELVTVQASHVAAVLHRYLVGEFSASDVGEWAELLEGRDDLGFGSDAAKETIHRLAHQATDGVLTPEAAKAVAAALADEVAGGDGGGASRPWVCPWI